MKINRRGSGEFVETDFGDPLALHLLTFNYHERGMTQGCSEDYGIRANSSEVVTRTRPNLQVRWFREESSPTREMSDLPRATLARSVPMKLPAKIHTRAPSFPNCCLVNVTALSTWTHKRRQVARSYPALEPGNFQSPLRILPSPFRATLSTLDHPSSVNLPMLPTHNCPQTRVARIHRTGVMHA